MHHIETPSPVTEGGIKGMGEAGTIAAPAAVVNAIADALSPFNVTFSKTPLTPSVIRDTVAHSRLEPRSEKELRVEWRSATGSASRHPSLRRGRR